MSDYIFNEKLLNEIHLRSEKRISKKEGREESQREIAMNLLKMGLPVEQISQGTGLPIDVVYALAENKQDLQEENTVDE